MILESILVVFLYMTLVFVIATLITDNSIVDIAWGIGFILVSGFVLLQTALFETRHIILFTLIAIWGLRLSYHIGSRHKGEDWRYAKWRSEWTYVKTRSFFQVFMFQGFFMLIVSSAALFTLSRTGPGLMLLDIIGIVIWIIGFMLEAIADSQVADFIKNRKSEDNRICKEGLWKYSRHPNYFGEATMWWGIFVIAFSATGNWWLIISPITITFLVRYISGVPMMEQKYKGNKEFEAYAKVTSPFIPLPNKKF